MNMLEPGKYVVAVSGGVDSVALLHMLTADPKLQLIVAHFDHGIRNDSADDATFVVGLCEAWGLQYVCKRMELGLGASEDMARQHRYEFLRSVCVANDAVLVTAHHQDDVIETAAINVLRGTHRRGLVALKSTSTLRRPLLNTSKQELLDYALNNQLEWCQDSTNSSDAYLRNRVRAQLKLSLDVVAKEKIVSLLSNINKETEEINRSVLEILQMLKYEMTKAIIVTYDAAVVSEILAEWLRHQGASFNRITLQRIITGAQTLNNGAQIDVDKEYYCLVGKEQITLMRR